jgi:uncharacterized membrane protein
MKRLSISLKIGLVIAVVSLVAGLTNKPVTAQDTSNFTISSFKADYYLDKDSDGRSRLKTIERITAVFPQFDQNHGIERALPQKYDNHSTSLRIESVKDEEGKNLPYSDSQSNDNLVLRIGEEDTYVRGEKTYVITYTQRDVTRFFNNTNADEYYWDVNGTGWAQPMNEVIATIHIPMSLGTALNDKTSCYVGGEGSTKTCPIVKEASPEGDVLRVKATSLGAHENMTFAIGFKPGTFVGYQMSWQERVWTTVVTLWQAILVITSIAAVGILIRMIIVYRRLMHRAKGHGTIVPEYLPPKNASVLLSAQVINNSTSDITAQIIDLAVRHYIKIYQTKEKTLFKSPEYEIEIIKDISDLRPEEQKLLKNLFGNIDTIPGKRFNMSTLRKKYDLAAKLVKGRGEIQKSARNEYGIYERAAAEAKGFKTVGFVALGVGVVTFSPLIIIVAIIAFILSALAWPLTEKGVALKEYLEGIKLYINVAEKERIQMLQSPEGAEKIGQKIDDGSSVQLVKLYERVLPYAVLFGIEKEWVKQLGAYYEASNQQPDWYTGNGTFNAAVFSSAVHTFSTQTSTYSSATSSSSGGSGGGGSSGGGGGGGGGGGW